MQLTYVCFFLVLLAPAVESLTCYQCQTDITGLLDDTSCDTPGSAQSKSCAGLCTKTTAKFDKFEYIIRDCWAASKDCPDVKDQKVAGATVQYDCCDSDNCNMAPSVGRLPVWKLLFITIATVTIGYIY